MNITEDAMEGGVKVDETKEVYRIEIDITTKSYGVGINRVMDIVREQIAQGFASGFDENEDDSYSWVLRNENYGNL